MLREGLLILPLFVGKVKSGGKENDMVTARKPVTAIIAVIITVAMVVTLMAVPANAATKQTIKVKRTNYVLAVGSKYSTKPTAKTKMTFSSDNPSVASVSQSGKIVANRKGVTKIRIKAKQTKKYNGANKTLNVIVVNKYPYSKKTETYTDKQKKNAKIIYKFLKKKGYTTYEACAIIGNMHWESALDPKAVESNGDGVGLCMWSYGRKTNLKEYAKSKNKSWKDINVQLEFFAKEMKSYTTLRSNTSKSNDVEWITDELTNKYFRPGVPCYEKRKAASIHALKVFWQK